MKRVALALVICVLIAVGVTSGSAFWLGQPASDPIPDVFAHQGRLLDADGRPITSTVTSSSEIGAGSPGRV
jgi:hypothetical protein